MKQVVSTPPKYEITLLEKIDPHNHRYLFKSKYGRMYILAKFTSYAYSLIETDGCVVCSEQTSCDLANVKDLFLEYLDEDYQIFEFDNPSEMYSFIADLHNH